MKLNLTGGQRVSLAFFFFAIAVVGFMVKLPSPFRRMDKELHSLFYFLAAGFLNILFAQKKLVRHLVIFAALFGFSLAIEYGQAYSNRFFRSRIHGRFDPEDVAANLKGLIAFSVIWVIWAAATAVRRKYSDDKIAQ